MIGAFGWLEHTKGLKEVELKLLIEPELKLIDLFDSERLQNKDSFIIIIEYLLRHIQKLNDLLVENKILKLPPSDI
jgi:hypothetical protein